MKIPNIEKENNLEEFNIFLDERLFDLYSENIEIDYKEYNFNIEVEVKEDLWK